MFSTVTSALANSDLTISRPRGDLRLRVIDFLLALNWWKYHGSSSGWPGRSRRPGSPVVGFSILTTSAPSQASASVHDGPASNWVKSTTLTPARQSSSTPIPVIARTPPVNNCCSIPWDHHRTETEQKVQLIPRILAFHEDLTTCRHDIHAHPELGFEERRTSDLVAERLAGFG